MSDPNLSLAWGRVLVDELARCGVRHAVVSPGSRSAPLALALAADPRIADVSILDERAAAFFGLGLARASRRPVALVCTSGTAAANYLPAVVEAHHSGVPLVVLTADRPPEHRDCGAGQAIEQPGLYGRHVRFAADLPAPRSDDLHFRQLRTATCRAVAEARGERPGPVHLNIPLREPLAPVPCAADQQALAGLTPLARQGRADGAPFVRVDPPRGPAPDPGLVERLAARIAAEPRGWLLAGPLDATPELAAALGNLARACDWPLLADALSQLRSGPHDRSRLVDAYDAVLRTSAFCESELPRLVLRFGALPTSKRAREILEAHPEIEQWVVEPWDWREPTGLGCEIVRADPLLFARALCAAVDANSLRGRANDTYTKRWTVAGQRARSALAHELAQRDALGEPDAVDVLCECAPDGLALFAASSMPVRDVDAFWSAGPRRLRVLANRGANGIDGTLASALGSALGCGAPSVALVGDLALLHDLSSALAARSTGVSTTVVVLDNAGGGIFEFLPIATSAPRDVFERHFATPQGVDIAALLTALGLECHTVATRSELRAALLDSLARPGLRFLRVVSDRGANRELHAKLLAAAATAVAVGDAQ